MRSEKSRTDLYLKVGHKYEEEPYQRYQEARMDRKRIPMVERLVGIAALFSVIVGFMALLVAIVAFLSGEYSAAGLSLIAAALSFGLVSAAILKS